MARQQSRACIIMHLHTLHTVVESRQLNTRNKNNVSLDPTSKPLHDNLADCDVISRSLDNQDFIWE